MTKYTGYVSTKVEFDAMDIPTMRSLSLDQYKGYVREELLWKDHHEIVRACHGEYPVAVTVEQIDALIEILQEWRDFAAAS